MAGFPFVVMALLAFFPCGWLGVGGEVPVKVSFSVEYSTGDANHDALLQADKAEWASYLELESPDCLVGSEASALSIDTVCFKTLSRTDKASVYNLLRQNAPAPVLSKFDTTDLTLCYDGSAHVQASSLFTDYQVVQCASVRASEVRWKGAKNPVGGVTGSDYEFDLAVSGDGKTLMAVWSSWAASIPGSTDNLSGDSDILFSRSLDGGVRWSNVRALNTNAASDSGEDRNPRVIWMPPFSNQGRLLAVWVSTEKLDSSGNDVYGFNNDLMCADSEDGGTTWSAPRPLHPTRALGNGNDDEIPHLSRVGTDGLVVVWVSRIDSYNDRDVLISRSSDGGQTWTAPAVVSAHGTSSAELATDYYPTLKTISATKLIAAWDSSAPQQEDPSGNPTGVDLGTDKDILFSISSDGGVTWADPAPLNTNADAGDSVDERVSLAVVNQNTLVAVWETKTALAVDTSSNIGTDQDIVYSRSLDGGTTWAAPLPISSSYATTDSGTRDQNAHVIALSDGETLVCVWSANYNNNYDVWFSRSPDRGSSWSEPKVLTTHFSQDSEDDELPQLVEVPGTGELLVVWLSFEDFGGQISGGGDHFLAWSSDKGLTWIIPPLVPY